MTTTELKTLLTLYALLAAVTAALYWLNGGK
jgi:hypothetical protein